MTLKLFNTLTRANEAFAPIEPGKAGMYTCGPTVYHFAHIGNLRTYVFEDLLKRALMLEGLKPYHVMNITDVGHLTSDQDTGEDKMEQGAAREGKSVWEIAAHYTRAFQDDISRLNVLPPDVWCKATDHIPEQIGLVQARLKQLMPKQRKRVARVVAEGLTNRQAAERLFLSVKTVDAHLQAIFRKLAVNTRAQLAGEVIRRGGMS